CRPWLLLLRHGLSVRRGRFSHPEALLRRDKHRLKARIVADCIQVRICVYMPHPDRAVYPLKEWLERLDCFFLVAEVDDKRASDIVPHVQIVGIEQECAANPFASPVLTAACA